MLGPRALFSDEHSDFRESAARFVAEEVVPCYAGWSAVPGQLYSVAADHGFVGMQVGEEHGGAGVDDVRFRAVVVEEAMLAGVPAFALGLGVHNDVCVPALLGHGSGEQLATWAPGLASGLLLTTFVDAALTCAHPDGGTVLEGEATFVLNGCAAELLLAVADRGEGEPGLFAVRGDAQALERTPSEELIGLQAADLADVRLAAVEAVALGGAEAVAAARADRQLSLAVAAVAGARAALGVTLEYVHDRRAFGQPIARFENTRMSLAAVAAGLAGAEALVDACLLERNAGTLGAARAAAAKLQATELLDRAVDAGVQLHGGYGYMTEYPIARAYADARFLRVHGGSSEALREVVAAAIGL